MANVNDVTMAGVVIATSIEVPLEELKEMIRKARLWDELQAVAIMGSSDITPPEANGTGELVYGGTLGPATVKWPNSGIRHA
ncbi:MAG TPA: hypothetical protein ENH94_11515 [Phycisphaerales bacterium]|nr:hypothetical protein [Phycisphaerales bacterium]